MEYIPIILTVAVCILTLTLVIVGIYVIQILQRVKVTMDRLNNTIDLAESKIMSIASPFQSFVGMSSSLGAGLKVFESFVGWLNRNKNTDKDR